MRSAYLAVITAYSTPWPLRVMAALIVLFLTLAPIGMDTSVVNGWPVIPVLMVSCIGLFGFAVSTKEQFTTPLARVVPGFSKHQLAVCGGFVLVLWLAVSGVLAAVTAAGFWGTGSMVLAMIALIAWGSCLQPVLLLVFVLLAFLPPLTPTGLAVLITTFRGDAPWISAGLLATAVVAFAVLGTRLVQLAEDQPAYRRWFSESASLWGTSSRLSEHQGRSLSHSWIIRRRGERLDSLLSAPVVGWRGDIRRLRAASGYPSPAIVVVAILIVHWLMMLAIGEVRVPDRPPPLRIAGLGLYLFCIALRHFRRHIPHEAIMPVERSRLFRQMGLIIGIDLVKAWAAIIILVFAVWSVGWPQHVLKTDSWQAIAIAGCGLPLCVGFMGYMMLIRSEIAFFLIWTMLYVASVIAGGIMVHDMHWLTLSLLLLAAGWVACRGAYRAWLRADLE